MKKMVLVLAVCVISVLMACNNDSATASAGSDSNSSSLVGTWKRTSISSHTSDIRWDTVLTTFLIGGTMSFNTHSRDSNLTTHEIQFDTITIPGTWSTSGNTLYVVENHKTKSYYDTATYAISGSRLVLSHSKAGVSDSVVMIRQ